MRTPIGIAAAACLTLLLGCGDDPVEPDAFVGSAEQASARGGAGHDRAADAATKEYEVTIENLTEGQPFSPGVLVTHTKAASVWAPGEAASPLIVNIAETGLGDPTLSEAQIEELRGTPGVFRVVPTGGPIDDGMAQPDPLPNPPSARTFDIEAAANANRLSIAVMLICTNDGFTGVHGVKLPGGLGTSSTYYAVAYDAGSEENTEDYADIVDPCQIIGPAQLAPDMIPAEDLGNDRTAEDGVITVHPGIDVDADLGPEHDAIGWGDGGMAVARIHVRRTR